MHTQADSELVLLLASCRRARPLLHTWPFWHLWGVTELSAHPMLMQASLLSAVLVHNASRSCCFRILQMEKGKSEWADESMHVR